MKDVPGTLRRIDEQIVAHNQSIARSRLEIARLQETRLVLMGLAEEDIVVAEMSKQERQGMINGAHSVPQLIVRKIGSGDEEGSASAVAKYGVNKSGNKRGMNNPPGKKIAARKPRSGSLRGEFKRKVTKLLSESDDPLSSQEMANYFGLPRSMEARKPLQNALYWMRSSGVVHRDTDKRYHLAKLRPPPVQPNGQHT